MNRKEFFTTSFFSSAAIVTGTATMRHIQHGLSADLVREFVLAGHRDLVLVKDMLIEYPELLHASYDWGNGDFEMAIEGAAHVGNKAIVRYLIAQGARVNLFMLTMLGKKDLVIPVLEEFPDQLIAAGPHGFSLLHHAKVGGEEAHPICTYLISKGLTESKWT